jgi:BMFP domain-containing protein YqiC
MQKDNKFFEDIARLTSGAAGGLLEMKREIDSIVAAQLEKLLQRMNLVTREDFDTVQGMLAKSRIEQEEMKKRLDALEQRINNHAQDNSAHN